MLAPGSLRRYGRTTLLACLIACLSQPVAEATWSPSATGSAASRAHSMPAGNPPTATVSNRSVTVSWSQSSFPGGSGVSGYVVKRYDASNQSRTVSSSCSGTISGLTCTENAVPSGTWKYSVTPKQGNWLGAESAKSSSVTVASPSLSFSSSTTVTSLPTTLNGSIANFVPGQTVTYKLDDPSTGTTLSGTTSPSTIPSSGDANITVTIPSGTSNGSHTVYAVGSQGDVGSAAISVQVPTTITTSAWTVGDASSGTESNVSWPFATANDSKTYVTRGALSSAFNTSKFVDVDMYNPLPDGLSVSSASFSFKFTGGSTTACFYFETRRISTGALVATHGSSGSPIGCSTSSSGWSGSTTLSEVTTTTIANDLKVRIYMTNNASTTNTLDLGTLSLTTSQGTSTVYGKSITDSTGTGSSTTPWSLESAGDSAILTSAANWATTFSTSRYLKLTFPSYVPSSATSISASFKHSYKSTNAGTTTCWYFEVYNGTSLIGTHGSSSAPVSCNSSNTTWQTDGPISLPEVDTVAEANSLVIKIYAKNSGGIGQRKTDHDLATVSLNYLP